MAFRSRVVKITATLRMNSEPQQGFGFIVGENGGQLVVVTANHVVRGDDPGSEDKSPAITFFANQGASVQGSLQSTSLPQGRGDLAIILVPKPAGLTLSPGSFAPSSPARGEPVWSIGRAGRWNVPVSPGRVSGVEFDGTIRVEGLGIRLGSSGGPLISAGGVVGMIVTDSDLATEVTPIAAIKHQVADEWQYPWQLVASTAMAGPKPHTPPAAPPADSNSKQRTFWNHNGSVMYLVANGKSREFYYQQPRPGMVEAGAQPGSLLFQGEYKDGQYVGTAFIFNRICGRFPYDVKGPVLDEYRRVVMHGNAPRIGRDCQISGQIPDTLEFTLIQ